MMVTQVIDTPRWSYCTTSTDPGEASWYGPDCSMQGMTVGSPGGSIRLGSLILSRRSPSVRQEVCGRVSIANPLLSSAQLGSGIEKRGLVLVTLRERMGDQIMTELPLSRVLDRDGCANAFEIAGDVALMYRSVNCNLGKAVSFVGAQIRAKRKGSQP